MGAILCHLETHLKKLTLVGSLNEEGTSNCQRCYWYDQSKGQENKENGNKTTFYISIENKTNDEKNTHCSFLYI